MNNNPKKYKIDALSNTLDHIDSTIKIDLKKTILLKDFQDNTDSLQDFLFTKYIIIDMTYNSFLSRLYSLRDKRYDYEKAKTSFVKLLQEYSHLDHRRHEEEFNIDSIIKEYRFNFPMLASYLCLYSLWKQEAKVFLENDHINDEPFLDELDNPEEPEYVDIPKGTDRIKALSNALETLQPLATQEANESSLQNDYQQRRQWVEASLTQLNQKQNIFPVKIFEYDLDFVHKHQKNYPIICAYLYISDLLLHEIQLR